MAHNPLQVINARSILKHINSSISNNSVNIQKHFPFQTIQFSISMQFTCPKQILLQTIQFSIRTQGSIYRSNRTKLSGASTLGQSGPGSNSNEGCTLHFLKLQHYWNLTIRLFNVISRTFVGRGSYPSAEMQSVYSTASANWTKKRERDTHTHKVYTQTREREKERDRHANKEKKEGIER